MYIIIYLNVFQSDKTTYLQKAKQINYWASTWHDSCSTRWHVSLCHVGPSSFSDQARYDTFYKTI